MRKIHPLLIAVALTLLPDIAGAQDAKARQIAALQAEQEQAIERVVAIVNQPVHHYPRRSWAPVYSPGWFDPGALTPDFDHVDIRQSQQFPYEKQNYVTSTLNPTEMFYGPELEFNAMTKYFYVDRTVPKKRLTEDEMLEINNLYRIIGKDEHELASLEGRAGAMSNGAAWRHSPLLLVALLGIGGGGAIYMMMRRKKS